MATNIRRPKSPLLGMIVTTPHGTDGEIIAVDDEAKLIKVRFDTGRYESFAYRVKA